MSRNEPYLLQLRRAIDLGLWRRYPQWQAQRIQEAKQHNETNVALFRLPREIRLQILGYLLSGTILLPIKERDYRDKSRYPDGLQFIPMRVPWPIEEQINCSRCSWLMGSFLRIPGEFVPKGTLDLNSKYRLLGIGYGICSRHCRKWNKGCLGYDEDEFNGISWLDLRPLLICQTFYCDAYDSLAHADWVLPRTLNEQGWLYREPLWLDSWPKAAFPSYVRNLIVENTAFSVGPPRSVPYFGLEKLLLAANYIHVLRSWLRLSAPSLTRLVLIESMLSHPYPIKYEYPYIHQDDGPVVMENSEPWFRYLDYILDFYDVEMTFRFNTRHIHFDSMMIRRLGKGSSQKFKPGDIPLDLQELVQDYQDKLSKFHAK